MAARVDGCTLRLPNALDVQRVRVDTFNLPDLGFPENIEKVDGQALRFAFAATTNRGGPLATRMLEGKCWIEAVVPREKVYGEMLRNLYLRVTFEKEEDVKLVISADDLPG